MRKIQLFFLIIGGALFLGSCGGNNAKLLPGTTKAQVDSVSYAVGVSFGSMLKGSNLNNMNYNEIIKAMQDVVNGKDNLKISEQEAGMIIQKYLMVAEEAASKAKTDQQAEFFQKNKNNPGVQQTESGIQYVVEQEGSDVFAAATDTVVVNYRGTLLDGTEFDSSSERGEPATFPLNQVIPGWTEGMQLVGKGGKIKLWIPYELGYGPRAMSEQLPGYSTLVFEVELLDVKKDASTK